MENYILTNKNMTCFFQKDGVLTSQESDAKKFNFSDAEQKSVDLQMKGIPVHWIHSLDTQETEMTAEEALKIMFPKISDKEILDLDFYDFLGSNSVGMTDQQKIDYYNGKVSRYN